LDRSNLQGPLSLRTTRGSAPDGRLPLAALLLGGLLFGFGPSVTSDAVEKVPTGGELTHFEAVGRARA
jgi:hypothetical protein